MTYRESCTQLKQIFNQQYDCIQIPNSEIIIYNFAFQSTSSKVLPGAHEYNCFAHNEVFKGEKNKNPDNEADKILHTPDFSIKENKFFKYSVFKKKDGKKTKDIIILFHGLNEKKWDKYLPWAKKLVELTGKTVVLFPIAFHMNRAPLSWSNPRLMKKISDQRKNNYPKILKSSFANAAISARIHSNPGRFFWSGLQTYYDVIKLITEIKRGNHYIFDADAKIDFFAYSIGSFLTQILLMANPENYFDNSKLFIFCGGPTFDRMSPVSECIIDSDAAIALYSFYIEHLENELKNDSRLNHYFGNSHAAGRVFKSMLSYKNEKELREKRLTDLSNKIKAVALQNDDVIQPGEVINTLKGENRNIPIDVKVLDFDHEYKHVTPFPELIKIEKEVDKSFNNLFEDAADWFMRS
jgi:hypothetical protein